MIYKEYAVFAIIACFEEEKDAKRSLHKIIDEAIEDFFKNKKNKILLVSSDESLKKGHIPTQQQMGEMLNVFGEHLITKGPKGVKFYSPNKGNN